jgi:hypothetical protein
MIETFTFVMSSLTKTSSTVLACVNAHKINMIFLLKAKNRTLVPEFV